MTTCINLGIFWTVYGIVGLLGFQVISPRFKGYPWTKKYIRCRGLSWLMLGIPWSILGFVLHKMDIGAGITIFIMLIAALPSLVYSVLLEKKFEELLENE